MNVLSIFFHPNTEKSIAARDLDEMTEFVFSRLSEVRGTDIKAGQYGICFPKFSHSGSNVAITESERRALCEQFEEDLVECNNDSYCEQFVNESKTSLQCDRCSTHDDQNGCNRETNCTWADSTCQELSIFPKCFVSEDCDSGRICLNQECRETCEQGDTCHYTHFDEKEGAKGYIGVGYNTTTYTSYIDFEYKPSTSTDWICKNIHMPRNNGTHPGFRDVRAEFGRARMEQIIKDCYYNNNNEENNYCYSNEKTNKSFKNVSRALCHDKTDCDFEDPSAREYDCIQNWKDTTIVHGRNQRKCDGECSPFEENINQYSTSCIDEQSSFMCNLRYCTKTVDEMCRTNDDCLFKSDQCSEFKTKDDCTGGCRWANGSCFQDSVCGAAKCNYNHKSGICEPAGAPIEHGEKHVLPADAYKRCFDMGDKCNFLYWKRNVAEYEECKQGDDACNPSSPCPMKQICVTDTRGQKEYETCSGTEKNYDEVGTALYMSESPFSHFETVWATCDPCEGTSVEDCPLDKCDVVLEVDGDTMSQVCKYKKQIKLTPEQEQFEGVSPFTHRSATTICNEEFPDTCNQDNSSSRVSCKKAFDDNADCPEDDAVCNDIKQKYFHFDPIHCDTDLCQTNSTTHTCDPIDPIISPINAREKIQTYLAGPFDHAPCHKADKQGSRCKHDSSGSDFGIASWSMYDMVTNPCNTVFQSGDGCRTFAKPATSCKPATSLIRGETYCHNDCSSLDQSKCDFYSFCTWENDTCTQNTEEHTDNNKINRCFSGDVVENFNPNQPITTGDNPNKPCDCTEIEYTPKFDQSPFNVQDLAPRRGVAAKAIISPMGEACKIYNGTNFEDVSHDECGRTGYWCSLDRQTCNNWGVARHNIDNSNYVETQDIPNRIEERDQYSCSCDADDFGPLAYGKCCDRNRETMCNNKGRWIEPHCSVDNGGIYSTTCNTDSQSRLLELGELKEIIQHLDIDDTVYIGTERNMVVEENPNRGACLCDASTHELCLRNGKEECNHHYCFWHERRNACFGKNFHGSECQYTSDKNCSGNGKPNGEGKCTCDEGFYGDTCSDTYFCEYYDKDECNNNNLCEYDNDNSLCLYKNDGRTDANGNSQCEPGKGGPDCNIKCTHARTGFSVHDDPVENPCNMDSDGCFKALYTYTPCLTSSDCNITPNMQTIKKTYEFDPNVSSHFVSLLEQSGYCDAVKDEFGRRVQFTYNKQFDDVCPRITDSETCDARSNCKYYTGKNKDDFDWIFKGERYNLLAEPSSIGTISHPNLVFSDGSAVSPGCRHYLPPSYDNISSWNCDKIKTLQHSNSYAIDATTGDAQKKKRLTITYDASGFGVQNKLENEECRLNMYSDECSTDAGCQWNDDSEKCESVITDCTAIQDEGACNLLSSESHLPVCIWHKRGCHSIRKITSCEGFCGSCDRDRDKSCSTDADCKGTMTLYKEGGFVTEAYDYGNCQRDIGHQSCLDTDNCNYVETSETGQKSLLFNNLWSAEEGVCALKTVCVVDTVHNSCVIDDPTLLHDGEKVCSNKQKPCWNNAFCFDSDHCGICRSSYTILEPNVREDKTIVPRCKDGYLPRSFLEKYGGMKCMVKDGKSVVMNAHATYASEEELLPMGEEFYDTFDTFCIKAPRCSATQGVDVEGVYGDENVTSCAHGQFTKRPQQADEQAACMFHTERDTCIANTECYWLGNIGEQFGSCRNINDDYSATAYACRDRGCDKNKTESACMENSQNDRNIYGNNDCKNKNKADCNTKSNCYWNQPTTTCEPKGTFMTDHTRLHCHWEACEDADSRFKCKSLVDRNGASRCTWDASSNVCSGVDTITSGVCRDTWQGGSACETPLCTGTKSKINCGNRDDSSCLMPNYVKMTDVDQMRNYQLLEQPCQHNELVTARYIDKNKPGMIWRCKAQDKVVLDLEDSCQMTHVIMYEDHCAPNKITPPIYDPELIDLTSCYDKDDSFVLTSNR